MNKLDLLITLLFSATIPIASAAAPANDNFANSQTITAGLTTTNISEGTVEAGELDTTIGRTVWYNYTAPTDSIVTLDSTGTGFEQHFVSVYMGITINNLIYIDSGYSGDYSATPFSFSFKAKAGSTYKICAGLKRPSFSGTGREVKITILTTSFVHTGPLYSNQTPTDGNITNDLFENRTLLSGNALTAINYMNDSTSQAAEPDTNVGKTAWYTYTAASDLIVSIDTTGTEFQRHFVSVYMGTAINNLTEVTSGYSGNYSATPFNFSFKAKAGTTYQICVGSTLTSLNTGATLLQLTLTTQNFTYLGTLFGPAVPTAPTPANDSFSTPQVLSGNVLTVIGSTASATIEPGGEGFEKTLWYTWKTSSNKLVRVDFPAGSSGGFAVLTGDSIQTITEVEKTLDPSRLSHSFNAVAGVTYRFVIGSTYAPFQFTLTATDPPANDAPFAKITSPKGGRTVSVKGFYITGYFNDNNGIAAFQIKVNGKLVHNRPYPYAGKLFSGKVKKGVVTLQIRAKDTLGLWGIYQTVKVKAK